MPLAKLYLWLLESRKRRQKLKSFYMNSLADDVKKDVVEVNRITLIQIHYNKTATNYLEKIYKRLYKSR